MVAKVKAATDYLKDEIAYAEEMGDVLDDAIDAAISLYLSCVPDVGYIVAKRLLEHHLARIKEEMRIFIRDKSGPPDVEKP